MRQPKEKGNVVTKNEDICGFPSFPVLFFLEEAGRRRDLEMTEFETNLKIKWKADESRRLEGLLQI